MTHATLIKLGEKWLRNRSTVVFSEMRTYAKEIPDAIGFSSSVSIVIECKTSRADFLRDKKKLHRVDGMGNRRYFLCPEGLIKAEDLQDGWGLLWAKGDRVTMMVACTDRQCCIHDERAFLVSMLRRAQLRLGSRKISEWLRMENMFEAKRGIPPNLPMAEDERKNRELLIAGKLFNDAERTS